jgi:hypothetical protein
MKIKVRFTDRCLVIQPEPTGHYSAQFYMTLEEFEEVLEKGSGAFNDCGEICMVRTEQLVFVENVAHKHDLEGTTRYARVPMDCRKFFERVKDLRDRGFVKEQFVTLDSESFQFKRETASVLGFAEILKHNLFRAKDKLFEAVRIAPADQLMKLREDISRMIRQGKVIAPDHCEGSFYFYPENGQGYNGGIIFHKNSQSYSVHT